MRSRDPILGARPDVRVHMITLRLPWVYLKSRGDRGRRGGSGISRQRRLRWRKVGDGYAVYCEEMQQ